MTQVLLGETIVQLNGNLPSVGSQAPDFLLVEGKNLENRSLGDYAGKRIVMNIFPTINTPVCSASAKRFNEIVEKLNDVIVLCISKDLPWNQENFCSENDLNNVVFLSDMRNHQFGEKYGIIHQNAKFQGLLARCVLVLNQNGTIEYTELVEQTGHEPDYDKVLEIIQK